MRFFIALEIPSENLAQLQAIQRDLQTLIPQIRLTALDKIHLTLVFVGEQQDSLKDDLVNVIHSAAKGISAFMVAPGYIDGFPTIHNPECLWVGVKGDVDKIFLIRERIKDKLEHLRLPTDERRFVPHITVAKLKHHIQITGELEEALEKIMDQLFNPIKISSIKLFESVPSNGFHRHNTLAEIKLS